MGNFLVSSTSLLEPTALALDNFVFVGVLETDFLTDMPLADTLVVEEETDLPVEDFFCVFLMVAMINRIAREAGILASYSCTVKQMKYVFHVRHSVST